MDAALADYNKAIAICPWSVDPVLNRCAHHFCLLSTSAMSTFFAYSGGNMPALHAEIMRHLVLHMQGRAI